MYTYMYKYKCTHIYKHTYMAQFCLVDLILEVAQTCEDLRRPPRDRARLAEANMSAGGLFSLAVKEPSL